MSVTRETPRRLLEIRLRRPSKGVRLMTADHSDGNFQIKLLAENEPRKGRWYDPRADAPDMLKAFTELASEDDYVRFASQWGMLGWARFVPVEPLPTGEWKDKDLSAGDFHAQPLETLADWKLTALELRTVAELRAALTVGDDQELLKIVQLDGNDVYFNEEFLKKTQQLHAETGTEQDWEVPDLSDAAESRARIPLAFIASAECEDKDLRRACWDLLAWSINSRTEYLLHYGVRPIDPQQPEKLELRFSSEGVLIGWLWLLLAESVAQGRTMKRCSCCGSWYFQHPDAKRKHGKYCSTKCRVAAWRARQSVK